MNMRRRNAAGQPGSLARHARRIGYTAVLSILAMIWLRPVLATSGGHRWTDKELVASYHELEAQGELEAAVRAPVLPGSPPQPAFLDALAWFAAGTPASPGTLTSEGLDEFLQSQAQDYARLLRAKVEDNDPNEYARTRTWKVIQPLTLLQDEMSRPDRAGRYAFPAISQTPSGDDPWEQEHTLGSIEEFKDKVCRASYQRPVLVKFGNTNCTQCMLFEMTGSVKEFAEAPAHLGAVDVYKVWWGLQPDASFAGKIRDPKRLDDLASAEGVVSSPTFLIYRNGRLYPCDGVFIDHRGEDQRLDACLQQEFGEAPASATCAADPVPTVQP